MKHYLLLTIAFLSITICCIAKNRIEKKIAESSSCQPFLFMENKGQIADINGKARNDIKFTAQSNGVKLFIAADGIYYQFNKSEEKCNSARERFDFVFNKKNRNSETKLYRLDMKLIGANPSPKIVREEISAYFENYFLANCSQGITNVFGCSKIIFQSIYPNIDWVIYTKNNQTEYDFIVHPGGNPNDIKIKYNYSKHITINKNGSATVATTLGEITEGAPVCSNANNTKNVSSKFVLKNNMLQFSIGAYDKSQLLVIDPTLLWSTYYGSSGEDVGYGCTSDSSGNIYLTGETSSTTGIAAAGGYQTSNAGFTDAFLVKFSSTGIRLWATYYGGNNNDYPQSCAIDGNQNIYLAGFTESTTGIAMGGFQNNYAGIGQYDAFLAKFNSSGSRVWATYYGSVGEDVAYSCAVDGNNNVYLSGTTDSYTNIANGGFQNTNGGGANDCFLVKFTASGSRLWATYFGDSGSDRAFSCVTDHANNVYLAGYTTGSTNIGVGGFQNSFGGSTDAILAKFSSTGSRLWSTYYGDVETDIGYSCAVDINNNVYLCGETFSDFNIASSGFQNTNGGGNSDAYLVKFDENGSRLWGTYYGKTGDDYALTCATDNQGNVYLGGETSSTSGISSNGFQNTFGGGTNDGFIAGFVANGTRFFGSYIGGALSDYSIIIETTSDADILVAGKTSSTSGISNLGYQNTYGGGGSDAFLTKIENPCTGITASISYSGSAYACSSQPLLLQALAAAGYTYQWQVNGLDILGETNSTLTTTHGGNYVYIVTKGGICSDTSAVLFVDSIPPDAPICICTVDSISQYNVIVWEKTPSSIIDSFRVYREDILNSYAYIGAVPYTALSKFTDLDLSNANPNVQTKRYKLRSVDKCRNVSALSDYHNTIFMSDNGSGIFTWNLYEVQNHTSPVVQYILMRDSAGINDWRKLYSTSGSQTLLSDPDYSLYPNARYRIETNLGALSCTPTARAAAAVSTTRSNIKNRVGSGIFSSTKNEIGIVIAPNPATKFIAITIPLDITFSSIQILDNLGRIVKNISTENLNHTCFTIDVSSLTPAFYTVNFKGTNFITNKKLIIH